MRGQYNYYGKMAANNRRNFNIINFRFQNNKDVFSINGSSDISISDYKFGNIDDKSNSTGVFMSTSVKHMFSETFSLSAGVDYEYHYYKYNGKYPVIPCVIDNDSMQVVKVTHISDNKIEGFLYARYRTEKLIASISGRGIADEQNGRNLSFQATVKYNPDKNNTIIAAAGQYNALSQPIYYIRTMDNISSRQISLDYSFSSDNIDLNAAVYIKSEHTPLYFDQEYSPRMVNKKIYGMEIAGRYKCRNFEFDANYTYMNDKISYGGYKYHADNDFKHLLKLSMRYINSKLLNAAISYIYRPGMYYTPLESSEMYEDAYIPIYGKYNDSQYPAYSTFDLSINKFIGLKKFGLVVYVTISNLMNRSNTQYYYYNSTYSKKIKKNIRKDLFILDVL